MAAGNVNFGHMPKRAIGALWGVKIRKTGKSWKNRLVRSRAAGNIKNLHIREGERGSACWVSGKSNGIGKCEFFVNKM